MCVILICNDKKPSADMLEKCNKKNPDGIGIAWFEKNYVEYSKNLSLDTLKKYIDDLKLPFVIHFRLESIGGKNPLLSHPFEISLESRLRLNGKSKKVLFHNGTDDNYEKYLAAGNINFKKNELMSDSRAIAMILARNDSFLHYFNSGKFVILDAIKNGIRYYGDFETEDGILCSNSLWKNNYTSYGSGFYGGWNAEEWYANQTQKGKIYRWSKELQDFEEVEEKKENKEKIEINETKKVIEDKKEKEPEQDNSFKNEFFGKIETSQRLSDMNKRERNYWKKHFKKIFLLTQANKLMKKTPSFLP